MFAEDICTGFQTAQRPRASTDGNVGYIAQSVLIAVARLSRTVAVSAAEPAFPHLFDISAISSQPPLCHSDIGLDFRSLPMARQQHGPVALAQCRHQLPPHLQRLTAPNQPPANPAHPVAANAVGPRLFGRLTAFRVLDGIGLLGLITPELQDAPDAFWSSLKQLDEWRSHHPSIPQEMVNPVLMGALLVPLGVVNPHEDQLTMGMLTLPRKDYERLRHLLVTVPKLTDQNLPIRVARGLPGRPSFSDAITWLDVFGGAPDAVAHWKHVQSEMPKPEPRPHRGHSHGPHPAPPAPAHPHAHAAHHTSGGPASGDPSQRKRRRRRRRGGGGGGNRAEGS